MTYEEFLEANRNKLLGYWLIAQIMDTVEGLRTPDPSEIGCSVLETLKQQLNGCMPLDSMIMDLWDWDVHFEECLGNEWYFESVFGSQSSLDRYAEELSTFFLEKCDEYHIDYNQSQNDKEFERLIHEQARVFLTGWRKNVVDRYATISAERLTG